MTEIEKWDSLKDKLLNSEGMKFLKCEFLCSEKQYKELFDVIVTGNSSSLFLRYEPVLRNIFPIEMRDIFVSLINREMEIAANRLGYKRSIQHLSCLKISRGGGCEPKYRFILGKCL